MSGNCECLRRNFRDSLQLTYWILDSVATCHMTPEVSGFIPGSLEYTDKHIEVADRHHVMVKQKLQAQIKICDNNGNTFIETLHNLLWAPDLCDRLFSIITLINLGHICSFPELFFTVYFVKKEKNVFTFSYSAQKKHAFWGEIK